MSIELYWMAALAFLLGCSVTFYGMWNLQLGPENWKGVLSVFLGTAFVMCGTGLFLCMFALE